ncbi:MAG TPA: hypothetical protein VE968_07625, partial [Sphingomicrobium sp.]|nr:hypothetical protein [Sphingomicrobium sp.]
NYHRPSFFGIEAERELSTFAATFRPRIHDPQIRGMENGPYSPEGFLRGWNFGNTFGIRAGLLKKPDVSAASLPTAELNAAWAWNYHRAERSDALKDRCFVPSVDFFRIEGRTSRVALWPPGMPIWLPRVDYVLVGSTISGQKRYGLAPWRDVLDVVRRAGFDTTKDPLRLEYRVTPPAIANWVENIPCTDLDALRREYLRPDQILDRELLAAARESIDENEGEFRIVREILNPETGS